MSVVQNGHVGTDLLHHGHLVGDDDDGDTQALVDVLDEAQDGAGGGGVQGGGSLVAQQDLGVGGQGAGDGDALLLAAGELGGIGVRLVGKSHHVQKFQRPLFGFGRGDTGDLHGEADVFEAGALHEQIELLEDHADGPAHLQKRPGGQGGHVLAVDDHMAGGGLLQQVDAPDQRGFAGAAHAHDAEDVPGLDGEAHILQGVKLTLAGGEGFGQVFEFDHRAVPPYFSL